MKKAIVLFWKGLKGISSAVAEWFTVMLGMKDESNYGKFIRRVVGGCFAVLMLVLACFGANALYRFVYRRMILDRSMDSSYYNSQYLSRNVTYYSHSYETEGYIETRDGKKTVKGIHWISKPLGDDSLVCYSNGNARGYFNMLTGDVAIKPQYKHAWVFSDGLASVDDNGWIKFIDAKGCVVIDPKIPYIAGAEGYVFHSGFCVLHNNRRDKFGMIDKQGKWVMKPMYDRIQSVDAFWIASKGGKQCVLNGKLEVVVPFMDADLWVSDNMITAEMADHTLRQYDLNGNLVDAFLVSGVESLVYESGELRYLKTSDVDEEGNQTGETEDINPTPVHKTARCKCYEAASGWYGLMSPDGIILTNPVYCEISAIGYDLYLCKKNSMCGDVLDGKGNKIELCW